MLLTGKAGVVERYPAQIQHSKFNCAFTDPLREFRSAMAEAGIITEAKLIPDGRLHRIHAEGHRPGSRNIAYVLHLDGKPAGWFQNHKSGVSGTWKSGGGRWRIDQATRQAVADSRRQRAAETNERQRKTADRARFAWQQAEPCAGHPYLVRKGVHAYEGVRVGTWRKRIKGPSGWRTLTIPRALLIPILDETGAIWNLQGILPEPCPDLRRDKDFLWGGRKAGLFFPIGGNSETLRIAEGYATGATVHAITRDRVFVAFDCGNLLAVARIVRKQFPEARIILMADNDRHRPGNPGVTKARAAALAVGGLVAIPEFPEGVSGSDWNDWAIWRREANNGST